jgi:hypothetical protein
MTAASWHKGGRDLSRAKAMARLGRMTGCPMGGNSPAAVALALPPNLGRSSPISVFRVSNGALYTFGLWPSTQLCHLLPVLWRHQPTGPKEEYASWR